MTASRQLSWADRVAEVLPTIEQCDTGELAEVDGTHLCTWGRFSGYGSSNAAAYGRMIADVAEKCL